MQGKLVNKAYVKTEPFGSIAMVLFWFLLTYVYSCDTFCQLIFFLATAYLLLCLCRMFLHCFITKGWGDFPFLKNASIHHTIKVKTELRWTSLCRAELRARTWQTQFHFPFHSAHSNSFSLVSKLRKGLGEGEGPSSVPHISHFQCHSMSGNISAPHGHLTASKHGWNWPTHTDTPDVEYVYDL